jgi:hypothetical protein
VPLLAMEVARFAATPLPVVLGWPLPLLYFWHAAACDLAEA